MHMTNMKQIVKIKHNSIRSPSDFKPKYVLNDQYRLNKDINVS